ncbi:glycosyltransferase [Marinilactibacillus psychrotolerans]|uniref:glycosyltransferase n=1 Tax=Marinilactibacillus psychrotolerans TaxID=191770 RepID=UPI0037FA986D
MNKDIKDQLDDIVIVIPSYNPDKKLLELIKNIRRIISLTIPIVIVNDGSESETEKYFVQLHAESNCTVLSHSENEGKGKALKTAFHYILNHHPTCNATVTVDGDGQHTPEDIMKCIKAYLYKKHTVILGSRNFNKETIPIRSRLGNIFTRKLISNMNNLQLTDTQTGLRVLPFSTLKYLIDIKGNRYEYEMNMLLFFKEKAIPIKEVPIETVYIENNDSSHFNPLVDSVKIYALFLKYCTSAAASFLVDISLFSLLVYIFENRIPSYYIILATIVARLASGCFNYLTNKRFVFRAKKSTSSVQRYILLFFIQMAASAIILQLVFTIASYETEWLIKILIDLIIFCISFYVQKNWVFKNNIKNKAFFKK